MLDRLDTELDPEGGYWQSLPLAAQALHVDSTPSLTHLTLLLQKDLDFSIAQLKQNVEYTCGISHTQLKTALSSGLIVILPTFQSSTGTLM
jgi:hypothetical protein